TGRPVRMHNWSTGNSTVVWAIDPDAYGMDRVVVGPGVFQPIAFAGQYVDAETASFLDDGVTRNRPGLVLNGFRTYDPFTRSYLQLDPMVEQPWSPYAYAEGNPVGKSDPSGLFGSQRQCNPGGSSFRGPPIYDPETGNLLANEVIVTVDCWEEPTGEWMGGEPIGVFGSLKELPELRSFRRMVG